MNVKAELENRSKRLPTHQSDSCPLSAPNQGTHAVLTDLQPCKMELIHTQLVFLPSRSWHRLPVLSLCAAETFSYKYSLREAWREMTAHPMDGMHT